MPDIRIQPYSGGNFWDGDPVAGGNQFAPAISAVESGGNYRAVGPETGRGRALGKYQVMDFNVGPWSKEVLGREVTPQEFIGSPQLQDAIFNAKFGQYVTKYGPEGAARAWFAGEGGMNDMDRRDVLGTSVADYSRKFTSAMPQAQEMSARSGGNFWDADPVADPNALKELSDISENALKPKVGQGRAALEGFLSGASGNFRDEIYGASAASGLPEWMGGFRAPVGAAKLAYETYTGQPGETTQTYEQARDRIRAVQEAGREQNPGTTIASNIAGAVALPVGRAMTAATLPGRMAQGALLGAGYGAVYGAGEGTGLQDRAERGAMGGATGAVVGAVAPAAIEGVVRGARAVGTGVANTVRSLRNPEGEAARRIALAVQRDVRSDPGAVSRLNPREFATSAQTGGPATIMDLGGETTRALARSAANTSPEGRGVLNRTINDRFEGQAGRIVDWLRRTFHYPNVEAQRAALEQASRAINRPAYQRAYADGARAVLWNESLEQLAQAPEVQSAIRIATPQLRNWAVRDGFRPPAGAFVIDGTRTILRRTESGNTVLPSLQYWDYVKRALDQMNTPTSRQFARALRTELDQLVPSYQAARGGAAAFFGADNALEAGQNFVMQNFANGQVRRALSRMNQTERQLFQDGFVSRFIETLERTGNRRNIINQIAQSPAALEKLNIALGPQRARELEAIVRVEGIMDLARSAVQGNSTTARQLAELGLAGGAYGLGTGGDIFNPNPTALMNAAIVYSVLRGRARIDENVSRRVAQMLTSNDPRILTRGIQMVVRNQQLFNSLRAFDAAVGRAGITQSPVRSLQSAATGRAENDQPEVPRPPGQ